MLIVLGLLGGTVGTCLGALGEGLMRYGIGPAQEGTVYSPFLTAAASVVLVVAGVLMLLAGGRLKKGLVATGKKLSTVALWLVIIAFAVYVLGFIVCFSATNARG